MRHLSWPYVLILAAACLDPQLTLRESQPDSAVRTVVPFDGEVPQPQDDDDAGDEGFRDSVFGYLDASLPDLDPPCTPGQACEVESGCRRGEVACGEGGPVCVALAEPFTARTTGCGEARACDGSGGCTPCGGELQPCCGTTCIEGLSCMVDGTCRTCEEGGDCLVDGEACMVGSLHCAATATCDDPTPRDRGVTCGNAQACDGSGSCVACGADGEACCAGGCDDGLHCYDETNTCFACELGAECAPDNPCRLGLTRCADGKATCDAYVDAPRGQACGEGKACDGSAVCQDCGGAGQPCCDATCDAGLVCSATGKTCTACNEDAACLSPNGCRSGTTVCDEEGAAQCRQDEDVARAESCGDGKSCDGEGNCVACGHPGEPCCGDSCLASNVCDPDAQTCKACPQGGACLSDDGCDTGTVECSSGQAVCVLSGVATRGTDCGDDKACDGAGACEACGDLGQPCCDGACGSQQRCSPQNSCEGCPEGTVYVGGGTFDMGAAADTGMRCDVADDDELPVHEVSVEPLCADIEEVSVARYLTCDDCTFPTLASEGMDPVEFDDCHQPSSPSLPMNCVTWQEAADYCESRDMRLPTEAEWEYLARGSDGRSYPWADVICDDCSRANVDGCGGGALATSALGDGASPFGLLNMAGNVTEWVFDRYDAEFYASPSALGISPRGPARGEQRVVRGGHFLGDFAGAASTERNAVSPGERRATVGLRCVRSMP
jgi:sulfatase modifying factor 1